ncbi:MAG TPA: polymorphic toxin type 44 domain-containing protein, partial [Pseudomonas sp.]
SYDIEEERRKWLEQPFYTKMGGQPNFHGIAAGNQIAAAALWAEMVGQDQEWDHKPKLLTRFNGAAWHKYGKHTYFYDIWSNIHYGYIGIACGFTEDWLFDGAGLEQIGSDSVRKLNKWYGTDIYLDANGNLDQSPEGGTDVGRVMHCTNRPEENVTCRPC